MLSAEKQAMVALVGLVEEQKKKVEALQEQLEEVRNEYIRTEVERQVSDALDKCRARCAEIDKKREEAKEEYERAVTVLANWKAKGLPREMQVRIAKLP
jgi:mannitol-1-phosphate/altronate dehydrogenase